MTNDKIQKAVRYLAIQKQYNIIDAESYDLAIATLEREGKEPCEYIQTDDDSNLWECSACGAEWVFISGSPSENGMNYCPHCGRKLEG